MPQVVGKNMISALMPIIHHSQHVPGSGAHPLSADAEAVGAQGKRRAHPPPEEKAIPPKK